MNWQYTKADRRRAPRYLIVAITTVLFVACDALTLEREPEEAHLELSSNDVSQVTLVTSKWFIEVEDPDCEVPGDPGCPTFVQLVEADTNTVSLPFKQSYPFNFRLQFFAEAYTTPPVEATLTMTVHLDDNEWYNDSRRLLTMNSAGEQETLRFVYQYHHLRLPGG